MVEPAQCPYCLSGGSKAAETALAYYGITRYQFNCGSQAMEAKYRNVKVRFWMRARCLEAAVARLNEKKEAA